MRIGERLPAARYIKGSNGNMDVSVYYSYNKNGDLTSKTGRTTAAIAYDGLEDLQEYIHRNHEIRSGLFYEYEYDDYKNWISKKEYRIKDDESELISWERRKIEYSTGKNKYEPMLDSIAIARVKMRKVALEGRISRENAKIEYENRPERPNESEISNALKTVITCYPEENRLLWKKCKKTEFIIALRKIVVNNEGNVKYEKQECTYGFGYRPNISPRINKKLQAECESFVPQIENLLINIPKVSKSKYGREYIIKIYFYDGRVSVSLSSIMTQY